MIPYFLHEGKYKNLSCYARNLYGLFLNRHSLSQKNSGKYTDNSGEIFFIYTIPEVSRSLNCSKNKAIKVMAELKKLGLIQIQKEKEDKPIKSILQKGVP